MGGWMGRWLYTYLMYGLAGGFDSDCAAEATSLNDHLYLDILCCIGKALSLCRKDNRSYEILQLISRRYGRV